MFMRSAVIEYAMLAFRGGRQRKKEGRKAALGRDARSSWLSSTSTAQFPNISAPPEKGLC